MAPPLFEFVVVTASVGSLKALSPLDFGVVTASVAELTAYEKQNLEFL